MFAAAPFLLAPVAAYNLFFLFVGRGLFAHDATARLTAPLFRLGTAGGGVWPVSASDLFVAGALVVFSLDLFRASARGRLAVVNHALSAALFTLCLAEMLLAPAFATSTFFLITLMVLLDVVAAFILTFGVKGGAGEEPEYR